MSLRILLVDDHPVFRAGLFALLRHFPGYEIVGEASTGEEALTQAVATRPDLVLIEQALPDVDGLEAGAWIRAVLPDVRLVVLAERTSARHVARALSAGVVGYFPKSASRTELQEGLSVVAAGGLYVSPRVDIPLRLDEEAQQLPADVLTERQLEVLHLLAEGRTVREVAAQLGLSRKTVEAHRANVMKRVGVQDLASLVRYAIREGIVGLDDD